MSQGDTQRHPTSAQQTLMPISDDKELGSQLLSSFILILLQERDALHRENAQLKKTASEQATQISTLKQALLVIVSWPENECPSMDCKICFQEVSSIRSAH